MNLSRSQQAHYISAAVVTAGVVGGAYYAYRVYKESSKVKLPEQWREVGTLKDLYVYPIKSCNSVVVDKAECSILGLRDGWLRDRVLMVVDEKNNFITARVYPELFAVHPTVRNAILTLESANMETIHVNLAEVAALQKPEKATVWGVEVPVYDCGREVNEWFSRLIGRPSKNYRLMYYASQNGRKFKNTNVGEKITWTKKDTGAFPDEVSYNLINESSVDELNTRLSDYRVSPRHFRPNFVVTGAKPYEEDHWKFVKIGDNVFEIVKPCTRCVMTTMDPETGVRNSEPLATLKTYRQIEDPEARQAAGDSPRMGLQMTLRSGPGAIISINDPVYVA